MNTIRRKHPVGRPKLSKLQRFKRKMSLSVVLLLALASTGGAIAGWFAVQSITQTADVHEICYLEAYEQWLLKDNYMPGELVKVVHFAKLVDENYQGVVVCMMTFETEGIAVDHYNIYDDSQIYNVGDNFVLTDTPQGVGISLVGNVMALENCPNGQISITAILHRLT